MIDLTPLEVRKKKGDFRRALRGYEPALVDDFLDIVADRLEQVVRENTTLTERVSRLEQQVAEFRDRERALTDALVTAQAMREEIKEQTTREADLLRKSSQQEAETRLRDAEQRAETLLRDAEQRSESLVRDAEQRSEQAVREADLKASEQLRRAQQEADKKLRQAEQESYQLRADASRSRDREEELLRRLRARQQQLLTSYRSFLERELAELNVITESLAVDRENVPLPDVPLAPAVAPPMPERTEPQPPPVAEAEFPPPPPDLPFGNAWGEPEIGQAEDEDEEEVRALSVFDEEPAEPFAPEPVYEEDLEAAGAVRVEPAELLREPPQAAPAGAEPGWPQLEVRPEFQPLPGESDSLTRRQQLWTEDAGTPLVSGDLETGEDDAETQALLENAARAGYQLDLEDDAELLLEEPAGEDEDEGGDDWLGSMIEEKK